MGQRRGKLETANGGTLFLDEVGDIGPKLQMDLLRVLEERSFSRVGGLETIRMDVRIVAATNRDLERAIAEGSFREDLYYRLHVIPIRLPPLRERREDIPLLVDHWLERLAAEHARRVEGVTAEAMERLCRHDWPGNVRELRNVLERATVVAAGQLLRLEDLGLEASVAPERQLQTIADVERAHVARTLAGCDGNVSAAARLLGIDRSTLYHKMRVYGLSRRGDAGPASEEPTPAS
jgi:DNA-binding NtrC family response regulator